MASAGRALFGLVASLVLTARAAQIHVTQQQDVVLKETMPGHTLGPLTHSKPPPYDVPGNQGYVIHQLRNPEYLEWVRKEFVPINHLYEEFAYTKDWEVFSEGGASLLHPQETLLILQCSPERLPFVRRMLKLWRGPMALAMFIPFVANSAAGNDCRKRMIDYVVDMNEGLDAPFALSFIYPNEDSITLHCNIDKESTGLEPAWMDKRAWTSQYYKQDYLVLFDAAYPVNDARNVAINMVKTNPFVVLADADFVPSGTAGVMYNYLKFNTSNSLSRLRTKWEQAREREVLILPAFERLRTNLHEDPTKSPCYQENPTCWVYEKMDVPYTKEKLVEMMKQKHIESFYMTRYEQAYGCYLANEIWINTTAEYEGHMLPECEPYIIGLKEAMPPYDNRFRGNRMDKVSFIRHMKLLGNKFTVEPNIFIIHLPHFKSHSLDDVVTWHPAAHDKMAYFLALESIFIGEKYTEVTLDRLLQAGVPREIAEAEAKRHGEQMALQERDMMVAAVHKEIDNGRKAFHESIRRKQMASRSGGATTDKAVEAGLLFKSSATTQHN